MFFILSKILAFLFSPLIWIITLFLFSLFSKDSKRKRKFLIWGIVATLFFTNSFIFDEFNRLWECDAVAEKDLKENYDAGIVLGSFTSYDKNIDRLQFNRGSDRLWQTIELFKKGKIKNIFYVGGTGRLVETDSTDADLIKRFLINIGIPDSCILTETESQNTRENALNSKKILDKEIPKGKFLLITSAFHMRRALGCFEKAGLKVLPYCTDRYSGKRKFYFDHLFIPNAYTLNSWDNLIHEWMGVLIYKIMGYA